MNTTKTTRKSKPLVVTCSSAEPGMPVLVTIARGEGLDCDRPKADKQSSYWCERLPSDWGIAARFSKAWDGRTADFANEVYDVMIDGDHATCECQGFLRHGHCKHVDCLRHLLAEGVLRLPPRPEHVEER